MAQTPGHSHEEKRAAQQRGGTGLRQLLAGGEAEAAVPCSTSHTCFRLITGSSTQATHVQVNFVAHGGQGRSKEGNADGLPGRTGQRDTRLWKTQAGPPTAKCAGAPERRFNAKRGRKGCQSTLHCRSYQARLATLLARSAVQAECGQAYSRHRKEHSTSGRDAKRATISESQLHGPRALPPASYRPPAAWGRTWQLPIRLNSAVSVLSPICQNSKSRVCPTWK